jgi:putative oxidoreductase
VKGLGLVVLRIVLAAVFVAHGANKLFGAWAGPGIGPGGLTNTTAFVSAIGLHPTFPLAVALGMTEFLGGVMIGVGLLTRWASLALVVAMGIGVWKVHLQWGFFLNWMGTPGRGQGLEFPLVLIGALLCLALSGGGEISVDGRNASSAAHRAAGRARLRGKV